MPRRYLLLAVGLLLGTVTSRAFTLTPISATLEPKGYGSVASFRLENESSNRMAFQVTIVAREPDEEGNEIQSAVTNLFAVFPPQGILGPGQKQGIRLMWKGPSNPPHELAYRIVAEQLPVDFRPEKDAERAQSYIQMLIKYKGTVYVRPKDARPRLEVLSLTRSTEAGSNLYTLVVTNSGSAHQGLRDPILSVTDAPSHQVDIPASQLPTVAGENILAYHTRRFQVTLPFNLKEQNYHARLHLEE